MHLLALVSLVLAADPKVELGRRLFMDPTVSRSGRFACASCHLPEHGFSDPRPLSEDETGRTRRHSQPLVDLAARGAVHWDGEFDSVSDLLFARLAPPEDALTAARNSRIRRFEVAETTGREPDPHAFRERMSRFQPPYYGDVQAQDAPVAVPLLRRLGEDGRYAEGFRGAYDSNVITTDRIVEAVRAYMLSLRSGESAFDRHRAGHAGALTESQARGLALFTGKANCAACHTVDDGRLTDGRFHNTGVSFRAVEGRFYLMTSLDGGAGEISCVHEDGGAFKTPSLRDVARHPPYMHDGSFATLEDVVRYYDRGGTHNARLDPAVRPLGLQDGEVRDLVAFLESLTGADRAGVGPLPGGTRVTRIRIVDLAGLPLKRHAVEVRPTGDRLEGARADEPPQRLVTSDQGYVVFVFPAWTHVRLVSATHEIHYDWPIPDYVRHMALRAAPRAKLALKVRFEDKQEPPEWIDARRSREVVARLRRVVTLRDGAAVYVGERHTALGTVGAYLGFGPGPVDLDLSGGWCDPLDLRPLPATSRPEPLPLPSLPRTARTT